MREHFDPSTTLDLEFGAPADDAAAGAVDAEVIEPLQNRDELDIPLVNPEKDAPVMDSVPLEKPGAGIRVLSSAAVEAGEMPLVQPEIETEPVEIILESAPPSPPASTLHAVPRALRVAPLGRRFLAGLADTLVLMLGGGLFALIFWAAGGRISPHPVNVAVLGSILVLFILAYFGLFTALSSSTPGLLWMKLEVRSLGGAPPTPQESFWRAFGYLVSIASLLLGFIWALVDGDGLTWHDRMSGTFITSVEG